MSRAARLRTAVPSLVLASAVHTLMSRRSALLGCTGGRSGRTYRTPVADVHAGSHVLLSTDSPRWRHPAERPDVRLHLRGHVVTGSARVVNDDQKQELLRAVTTGGHRSIKVVLDGPR